MIDLKPKPTMTAAPSTPTAAVAQALANFDTLPESAHVRLPVVAALLGVGPATVWRWSKSQVLPPSVKLGPNTAGWKVGALRQFLAQRQAGL